MKKLVFENIGIQILLIMKQFHLQRFAFCIASLLQSDSSGLLDYVLNTHLASAITKTKTADTRMPKRVVIKAHYGLEDG